MSAQPAKCQPLGPPARLGASRLGSRQSGGRQSGGRPSPRCLRCLRQVPAPIRCQPFGQIPVDRGSARCFLGGFASPSCSDVPVGDNAFCEDRCRAGESAGNEAQFAMAPPPPPDDLAGVSSLGGCSIRQEQKGNAGGKQPGGNITVRSPSRNLSAAFRNAAANSG